MSTLKFENVGRRTKALWLLAAFLLLTLVPSLGYARPPEREDAEQQAVTGTGDPIGGEKAPPSRRTIRVIPDIAIEGTFGGGGEVMPAGDGTVVDQARFVSSGSDWDLRYWLTWIWTRFAVGRF
jgi:hypothetical protein